MSEKVQEAASGTQAIKRAVSLLRLIAANNRAGLRLVDLYTASGLERPTAHRLLQGLIAENLIRQDSKSKRYFLGRLMYEIGSAAAPHVALRDICHPFLLTLADRTGDTVFLTIRSGFDGLCVDRAEGAFPVKVFVFDVGRRRPLNIGASSIAILSTLADTEIDTILKANRAYVEKQYPAYSEKALRQRIEAARVQGYVLNEILEVSGVSAIGVPIRKRDKRAVGAISVSALTSRLTGERLQMVASWLIEAVNSIESILEE